MRQINCWGILVLLLSACATSAGPVVTPTATLTRATPTVAAATPKAQPPIPAAAREREFFLLPEFHAYAPDEAQKMAAFLKIVQTDPQPLLIAPSGPIRIAFICPSREPSDAWMRLNLTLRRRLDELGVSYIITEYLTASGEHEQQAAQIAEVLAQQFDYVVIGPSEYLTQQENLGKLAERFPTLVMNVVNPLVETYGSDKMPLTHIGFDHALGALALCDWVIHETGGQGTFALMRYIPGLVDAQRSDVFAQCLQEKSEMRLVADYAANGDEDKAFIGTNVILKDYPDITMIHAGNTATALGILRALKAKQLTDSIITNGWGGGADELNAIAAGELDVTPFRVNDDWGVAVAEAIKLHLEGRRAEIPVVIAATIKMIDSQMSAQEIEAESRYAFRYSSNLEP